MWLNGKSNHHFAAGSIAGIYSDLPSEPLYDDAADVQAKSGARFEVIYFGETFEHPFLLVGRDADARIGDGDHQLSFFFVDVAGQCDCSAFCKLGGVT